MQQAVGLYETQDSVCRARSGHLELRRGPDLAHRPHYPDGHRVGAAEAGQHGLALGRRSVGDGGWRRRAVTPGTLIPAGAAASSRRTARATTRSAAWSVSGSSWSAWTGTRAMALSRRVSARRCRPTP
ncbi:hypothetical protein SHO565_64170 [Streptomyces sp. HO565]